MSMLDNICEINDAHAKLVVAWQELKVRMGELKDDVGFGRLLGIIDGQLDVINDATARYRVPGDDDVDIDALLAEHFGIDRPGRLGGHPTEIVYEGRES